MDVTQKINKAEKLYSIEDYQGSLAIFNLLLDEETERELLDPYYGVMFDCYCREPLNDMPDIKESKLFLAIKAGERGNAGLSRYVAEAYIEGDGCKKDAVAGIRWYFTAIGNGDGVSCILMAKLFLSTDKDQKLGLTSDNRKTLGMEVNESNAISLLGIVIDDIVEDDEVVQEAKLILAGIEKQNKGENGKRK